jgi:hypothetical protein
MSEAEKEHIIKAFHFEVGKVKNPQTDKASLTYLATLTAIWLKESRKA